MKDKIIFVIGSLLILFALAKPNLSQLFVINTVPSNIEVIDNDSQKLVGAIVSCLKNGSSDRKYDGKRLASLYSDIATLISLDKDDEIIKNTEEIRQANSISGLMLKLNIKDKYPGLAEECNKYLVSIIGDDNMQLNDTLREKTVSAFKNLAWAFNEGSK